MTSRVNGGNPRQKTQKKRMRFFGVSLAVYLEAKAAAKEIQTISLVRYSIVWNLCCCLKDNLFGGMLKMLAAMENYFFHLRTVSSSEDSPRRGESSGAEKEVILETADIILIDIYKYNIYNRLWLLFDQAIICVLVAVSCILLISYACVNRFILYTYIE